MLPAADRRSPQLLSLREAAALTGVPRKRLRARIRRGEVPVRLTGSGKRLKPRLTIGGMVAAGLIVPEEWEAPTAAAPDLAPLVALLESQGQRLAALEDQRLQLAAQLGAALERTRHLEERLRAIGPSFEATPRPVDPAPQPAEPEPPNADPCATRDDTGEPPRAAAPAPADTRPPKTRIEAAEGSVPPTASLCQQPSPVDTPVHRRQTRAWRAGAFVRRGARRLLPLPTGPRRDRR